MIRVAYAATWDRVTSRIVLLPLKAMSGSMALLQPRSTLMFMDRVTTEGHTDANGLGHCLRSEGHAAAGAILNCMTCATNQGHGNVQARAVAQGHV